MKKGFTLAETLITLAVIGVVASLTIPNLVTANNKKLYASALASNVTNVENVLSTIILNEKVNYLDETELYNANSAVKAAGVLGKYIDITAYGTDANSIENFSGYRESIKGLSGNNDTNTMNEGYFFKLKNGALINFVKKNYADTLYVQMPDFSNQGLQKQIYTLTIDINGQEKPNKCGRDIFKYAVDQSGKLYPFGGKNFALYADAGKWDYHDGNSAVGNGICCSCQEGSWGWGCAGRLADNGYVMDY